jgi:hypothetical protein
MAKNQILPPLPVSDVGAEIGIELGNEMIKNYQFSNSSDVFSYEIGRKIIDQILAQPDCQGLKFYNAYNENGEKTLVYVGLDSEGKNILEFTSVSIDGSLSKEKGIVADRVKLPPPPPKRDGLSADDWGWTLD